MGASTCPCWDDRGLRVGFGEVARLEGGDHRPGETRPRRSSAVMEAKVEPSTSSPLYVAHASAKSVLPSGWTTT